MGHTLGSSLPPASPIDKGQQQYHYDASANHDGEATLEQDGCPHMFTVNQPNTQDLVQSASAALQDLVSSSSTAPLKDDAGAEPKLTSMSPERREMYYRKAFGKNVEPLTHIEAPDECSAFPLLADEIFEAYLRHTTFAVRVYVNYDALHGRFYNAHDQRFHTCGKLKLSPRMYSRIEQTPNFAINKVRFELCTAFNSLCTMSVRAGPVEALDGTWLRARLGLYDEVAHPELIKWLWQLKTKLDDTYLTDPEQTSMRLGDLEDLALLFRRVQTEREARDHENYPHITAWTEFWHEEMERNDGYVEFERPKSWDFRVGG